MPGLPCGRLGLVIGAARVGPALDGRTAPAIAAAEFGTCPTGRCLRLGRRPPALLRVIPGTIASGRRAGQPPGIARPAGRRPITTCTVSALTIR